jgi:hypothetical protein
MRTVMADRAEKIKPLLEQGYTVMDAGRQLGLSRTQVQDVARRYKLRALQGAIAEAKAEAGAKGNQVRWG